VSSMYKTTCFAVLIGLCLCLNVSADLDDGLRAYYKLDGNALDETGNHDGAVTGTTWVPGVVGSAASFNGTSDYITMGATQDILNSLQASFSLWVRFSEPSPSGTFLVSYDGGAFENGDILLRTEKGGFNTRYGTGNGTGVSEYFNTSFSETAFWHHVAVLMDNTLPDMTNRTTLYLDGVKIESVFLSTPNATLDANIGDTSDLLRMAHWGNNYWEGLLDEVRIYDRVLTESEIRLLAEIEPTALSEGYHVFDMKISTKLLKEKGKSTVVGKEKIQGLLVYTGETGAGQFIYMEQGEPTILKTDFNYAEYINAVKKTKKVSTARGVASAQITIDELLEAVALGNFRYLENPKNTQLIISLTGAGIAPEDEAYGTLQLRYNQKNSDKMNGAKNTDEALYKLVSKTTGIPIDEVKKAMSTKK